MGVTTDAYIRLHGMNRVLEPCDVKLHSAVTDRTGGGSNVVEKSERLYSGVATRICFDDRESWVIVTEKQMVLVRRNGQEVFVAAKDLKYGDRLKLSRCEDPVPIDEIKHHDVTDIRMFDFGVRGGQSYVANNVILKGEPSK